MKKILNSINKEDFFKKANLHIHSSFSDGKCTFDELIAQAQKIGLEYYSITDHNTLLGYEKLNEMPKGLIKGVEFDCFLDFNLPHIIGYDVDIKNEELKTLCSSFKDNLPARIISSRSPGRTIQAIHNSGGIAVLAHPCCYWCFNLDKFVKKLVDMGLDGIECYYPYDRLTRTLRFHSRKTVLKIAGKYNLVKTGGTDCHNFLEV